MASRSYFIGGRSRGLARPSRRKLLDRVVSDETLICGSRLPWLGLAKITKDGGNYAYITLQSANSWLTDLELARDP